MLTLLVTLLSQHQFPLPSIDNTPIALVADQTKFRLPMQYARVKEFYEKQLGGLQGISLVPSIENGIRVLKISNKRKTDAWVSAKVSEGEMETVIELKSIMRMGPLSLGAKGPPVQFILSRSGAVKSALDSIDHTEQMRAQ